MIVETARLSSRGTVTIPRHVRERLGLQSGDEIEFVEDQHGYRIQKRRAVSPFERYRGYLQHLAGRDPDELVEEMRGH